MRVVRVYCSVLIASLLVIETGCTKESAPDLLRTATIKDIMDSMVDPSGDFMFQSVRQISDEHGISEKAPKTDEEWEEVRHHLFVLIKAPNLLTPRAQASGRSHTGDESS